MHARLQSSDAFQIIIYDYYINYVFNLSGLTVASQQKRWMSASNETEAEFDARFEAYFNRPDIDGWEIR